MKHNAQGNSKAPERDASPTSRSLSYVTWETNAAILVAGGEVQASGDASPQVRNQHKLAKVGDQEEQAEYVRQIIVESFAGILTGMEPSAEQLAGLREDIASATLVSANLKLAAHGVSLLDLTIQRLNLVQRREP